MASGIRHKPIDAPGAVFHVTAHGVGDTAIFRSSYDKREFLTIYRNYLSPIPMRNSARRPYAKLHREVAVLGYCLLDNHFHLIVRQQTPDGMYKLMKRTQTAYVRYFNDRYGRRGPLFDACYAAKPVNSLRHARFSIAYAHLNHEIEQLDYEFSSHRLFLGKESNDWLDVKAGLAIFGGVSQYKRFLNQFGPSIIDRKLKKRGLCPESHAFRPIR
ncbi:MAG: hypothetical protein HY827_06870 [Actinobacteria bacterium]|nr:hypothetical protein [Actinomycetota bacterium]